MYSAPVEDLCHLISSRKPHEKLMIGVDAQGSVGGRAETDGLLGRCVDEAAWKGRMFAQCCVAHRLKLLNKISYDSYCVYL
jgi:hypothetical protein